MQQSLGNVFQAMEHKQVTWAVCSVSNVGVLLLVAKDGERRLTLWDKETARNVGSALISYSGDDE